MPSETSTKRPQNSRRNSSGNADTPSFMDHPGVGIAAAPERTKRAEEYEGRVSDLLNQVMRMCVGNESTVPDAATILTYGPAFASKLGDLADHDVRVRRAVDLISSGTDNPYIAMTIATLPFVMQIVRNHEATDLTRRVEIKIPFTKRSVRVPFKFRLKNKALRGMTVQPEMLAHSVFSNPAIVQALQAQGLDIEMNGATSA